MSQTRLSGIHHGPEGPPRKTSSPRKTKILGGSFNRKGPDGGDGGGGGGGDDDDDQGSFYIGTPNGGSRGPKKPRSYEFGKLFEAKDAKFLPEFNGKEKAGIWRRKVSHYLISKCPDMERLLEWVEQQKEVVDSKLLQTFRHLDPQDSVALSRHLWGFLNVSLVGDAWELWKRT